MKPKYLLIFFLFQLPNLSNAQGGLIIGSGINVVADGAPQIVINDGEFTNDGNFDAGLSTIYLKGNTSTEHSTIGGAALTVFNNLTISKSSHDVRLDFDIQVNGDIQMDGGLLYLNNSDIELGGVLLGETESTRITGTNGGAILKTLKLDMPVGINPGNLGIEISSASNLGSTTIRRAHVQYENEGNYSIYRSFDIDPENNSNLGATLRFRYFDAELDGQEEGQLNIWHYDEIEWESFGAESNNSSENWVEASGFSFFHTLTLAEDMNGTLPVELLHFAARVNEQKEVDLHWTTAVEINNDFFTIERSRDGIQFEPIENIPGAGNSSQARNYTTTDSNPYSGTSYYRLRQTDFDGTQSWSDIKAVDIELDQRFTIYPNPLKEVLHIVGDGSYKGKAIIEISDASGQLKYRKHLELDQQVSRFDVREVAEFGVGTYFLLIQTAEDKHTFNLVKVRE